MRRTISGTCYAVESDDINTGIPSTSNNNFNNDNNNNTMDADDICNLLGSLSLKGGMPDVPVQLAQQQTQIQNDTRLCEDSTMNCGGGNDVELIEVRDAQGNIQFIPINERPGCALIHSLQSAFDYPPRPQRTSSSYPPTTLYPPVPSTPNVNFLDTILTHREAFVAFPYGHRECSSALTALAFHLEQRSRDACVDGDLDTAIALHNEAWLMAGWR